MSYQLFALLLSLDFPSLVLDLAIVTTMDPAQNTSLALATTDLAQDTSLALAIATSMDLAQNTSLALATTDLA